MNLYDDFEGEIAIVTMVIAYLAGAATVAVIWIVCKLFF